MFTLIQWSSLQKIVSKIMPKKFYEIDPRKKHLIQNRFENNNQ
jgi:hypothetical protein